MEGDYTLWCNDSQCEGVLQGGFKKGRPGENGGRGEAPGFGGGAGFGGDGEMLKPEDRVIFEGMENGEIPEKPEGMEVPKNDEIPEIMEMEPMQTGGESNTVFKIVKGTNRFQNVTVINS